MKNTLRHLFLLLCLALPFTLAAETTTYDFNTDAELGRWNFVASNDQNVNYELTSKASAGWTGEGEGDQFLNFTFKNKGGESITLTTTESFTGITKITFDAVSQDDGKPSLTLRIVGADGSSTTLLNAVKIKSDLGAPGNKKWKRGYSYDLQTPLSGKVEFYFTSSTSGKQASLDNIILTHAGGSGGGGGDGGGSTTVASDATLSSLTYDGTSVPSFAPTTYIYNVVVASDQLSIPQVAATPTNEKAKVDIKQAEAIPGTATATVTSEDATKQQTYTIHFTVQAPPSTDLTTHTPGIYEANSLAGGYGGILATSSGREYEVYYANRASDGNTLTFSVTTDDKQDGIADLNKSTENSTEAADGWLRGTFDKGSSTKDFATADEFAQPARCMNMKEGNTLTLHISGYDQFSLYAKDNNSTASKGKHLEIYIDGDKQADQLSDKQTIRRYDISTGEHLIEIRGLGSSTNQLAAFSLRVADEPRVQYVSGNDSTQTLWQTQSLAPITYYTKYNSKGRTALEWTGAEATGISLTTGGSNAVGDTLLLGGQALCPVGVYNYQIVAYNQTGVATNRLNGKFTVGAKIEARTDTIQDGFTNEPIDGFEFRYYALSASDVTLLWTSGTPDGITGQGADGVYTISGTPTQGGTYPFLISVAGGNSIQGELRITTFDPGSNPILYLYKNSLSYEQDGIYLYLKEKGLNPVPRKAQDGLREAEQYAKYTWAVISEDVDANNGEIMALARGTEVRMPVLNLKSFAYSENRLDWGDPDNGSVANTAITVVQPSHPIFRALNKQAGDKLQIISQVTRTGLMPAAVDYQGTLCLATAPTRSAADYDADGEPETFLHEVPANLRQGAKYLCFPVARTSSRSLTAEGKQLLDACINYLLSDDATIALPTLSITDFRIDGNAGTIYEEQDSIYLQLPAGTDLTALVPTTSVTDPTTFVTCKRADEATGEINFSTSYILPIVMTVSDYINVRHYSVVVTAAPITAIDEVYEAGEWVKIYDIQGRLVSTTNEDIYTMDLPQGIYLIQTTRGTMKLLR